MRRSPRAPDAATGTASLPSAPAKRTHTYPRWPHTCDTNRQPEDADGGTTQLPRTHAERNSRYQSCAKLRPKAGVRATEESSKRHQMPRTKSSTHDSADAAKANLTAHNKHSQPTLTAPPKRPQAPTDAKGPPMHEKARDPEKSLKTSENRR